MNYATLVSLFIHIKAAALSLLFTGLSVCAAQAANLTAKEQNICPTLRVCIDIIRRHDATEFDYNVLEREFRRFGPAGRKALFDILESEGGNTDIARMISILGPLKAGERARIKMAWSQETSENYLPLLLDGHPLSRDLLLLSLGSDQAFVREASRRALAKLPKTTEDQLVSQNLRAPLLSALAQDPIAEAAPYLARLNAEGQQENFARLLRSGEPSIVSGAYAALYRHSPSQAFNALLTEMGRATSSEQSQAIGDMLLRRHRQRGDGFYLKFAGDISGDKTRPISARASGLHAVLIADGNELPEFTPERAEALGFLVKGQSVMTREKYLPYLKQVKAGREMAFIWNIAQQEKWINRDEISTFFKGDALEDKVIRDLIGSDDIRSFRAGVIQATPKHNNLLRTKADHAVKEIGDLARKKLKLPAKGPSKVPCQISLFDANDSRSQMPFFDTGWTLLKNGARASLDRKYLASAHPSKLGWLAGYKLDTGNASKISPGGALVHFDNKSGGFERVGHFSAPLVILPDRALKLGQATDKFWVIEKWDTDGSELSAFIVNLSGPQPQISHMGLLPSTAQNFTVAPNGDLLMGFKDTKQVPIRLTPRGDLSLACAALRSPQKRAAPN